MANYKIVDTDQLEADLASVADSIRAKAGTSGTMAFPAGFKSAVEGIEKGGTLQAKTVTPTTERQTVTADAGYYGLSSVTVIGVVGGVLAQNEKVYQFAKASTTGNCDILSGVVTAYGITY